MIGNNNIDNIVNEVLRHRILLNFHAETEGVSTEDIIKRLSDEINYDIPPRTSPADLKKILDALSELSASGETDIVKVIHKTAEKVKKRAMIILISDLFQNPDKLLDCFQHIRHRKHDLAVFHLMAPEELSFDFEGSVKFNDMETDFSVLSEPDLIQKEYHRELQNYLKKLKKGCREFNVDYRFMNISIPYYRELAQFIIERN